MTPTRHVDYDCANGTTTWRDASADEDAQRTADGEAYLRKVAADHARRQADLALVAAEAAANPAFAALARLARIPLPEPDDQK